MKCLELNTIPDITAGDIVMCIVHADAGETKDCADAVMYTVGDETATFTCTGTTLDYSCKLN